MGAAPRQIRVWSVTVEGYGSANFNAVSRGKAMAEAWRSSAFDGWSFKEFIQRARCKLAPSLADDGYGPLRQSYPDCCIPKPGTRISAEGLTGTVLPAVEPTSYVIFQVDGREDFSCVHPASVATLTQEQDQ